MASFEDKAIHYFTTQEAWEAFLADDPPDEGVRLQLRKKTSAAPGLLWQEALDVALCYGWIDGQGKRLDDDFTLQAFTPRRRNSPWSQINQGHVERLIAEGRMQPSGQAEIDRAKADGRWEAAYRQKDAVTPDDFQLAIDANPAAAATWAAMTKVNRFAMIFRLTQLKRPETRVRRIGEYVAMLARGDALP